MDTSQELLSAKVPATMVELPGKNFRSDAEVNFPSYRLPGIDCYGVIKVLVQRKNFDSKVDKKMLLALIRSLFFLFLS